MIIGSQALPPMAGIRAFLAVAETGSFTRAGQELGLTQTAVSHQIVLTKCDQLSATALAARIADVSGEVTRSAAAFPDIIATSSRDGTGIAELRAAIARLVAERR